MSKTRVVGREVDVSQNHRRPTPDAVVPVAKRTRTHAEGMTQTNEETGLLDGLEMEAIVPVVRVLLLQSVCLPPQIAVVAKVELVAMLSPDPVVLELTPDVKDSADIVIEDSLIK